MIENYEVNELGIISQVEIGEAPANTYANYYRVLERASRDISYLRLGYILGVIGNCRCQSILDIGYGSGAFLEACKSYFPKCAGFDVVDAPLPEGVYREQYTTEYYDVITAFDSIEHMRDPSVFVANLNCRYLVVSVPHCKHPHDDSWFTNWKHRKPNEHLHHFTHSALTNFFEAHGFEVLGSSFVEDIVRKGESENILTMVGKKVRR
jgi:hypothetical protein